MRRRVVVGAALLAACSQSPGDPGDAAADDASSKDATSDAPASEGGGDANGKCTPGQTRCTDDLRGTQSCDEAGNWDPALTCTNQTCVGGLCTGVCGPGETQCSGNVLQSCDGTGNWATSTTCPVACCSGACVDTNSDPNHCGSCGTTCASGYTCGTSYSAFTGTQPANWVTNGSATYDSGDNAAQLTDLGTAEAGTWVWSHPVLIDVATIQFDFYVGDGTGADGFAFMLETNGAGALGNGGGGLGVAGLSGFGVEFDEYNNGECLDATANHTGIDALAACGSGTPTGLVENDAPGFTIADATWHTAIVDIDNGAFTVTAANVAQFSSYKPSGWSNGSYYIGFGAGTGGSTNYHRVRNVNVKFKTGHCY